MNALNKLLNPKVGIPLATNLVAIGAATFYLRSHLIFNHEEAEARMDEIGMSTLPFFPAEYHPEYKVTPEKRGSERAVICWRWG